MEGKNMTEQCRTEVFCASAASTEKRKSDTEAGLRSCTGTGAEEQELKWCLGLKQEQSLDQRQELDAQSELIQIKN